MNVEGRGIVAPEPVWVPLTRSDFIVIKERACQQAMERDYRNRGDSWGRGLVGPGRPPGCSELRPESYSILLGMIGEYGTVSYINRQMHREVATMDFQPRRYGDRGVDVLALGMRIQVKTQQAAALPGLIRRVSERGDLLLPSAETCLFARFDRARQSGVWLLGWVWMRSIVDYPIVPARSGDHMNVEVPSRQYSPMIRLIRELKQRELS